jgi:transposase-like protein
MSILSKPYFHDETAAFEHLEQALWNDKPICPHCGTVDSATKLQGDAHRRGVWKCKERECRKQFTVKVGTVFEHGRIPLHKMLQAVHLMASSKKGISAHQLHRILEIQYKSAWFLAHRIREAMRDGSLAPMGGAGGVVEIDDTLQGKVKGAPKRMRREHMGLRNRVLTLVERGGSVRSFHVEGKAIADVMPIIRANVNRETRINTDEAKTFIDIGKEFFAHDTIVHGNDEYVRYAEPYTVTTNTVEGYFSIFKRGMKGVYQHCSEKHLHRYLAEFDFRYSNRVALGVNDEQRATLLTKGIVGKRLTYRIPDQIANA